MSVDEKKLETFMFQAVADLGATMNTALVLIGVKLGIYKAMAGAGSLTPADLARRSGLAERYLREWLNAQAAGGYVEYDAAGGGYTLPEEQALALADETSAVYLPGGYEIALSLLKDAPRVEDAFRTGKGVGWHEHDDGLYGGTEKFFKPSYAANLVSAWIPALDGVEARLGAGARVADVGCGFGASTILMAQAYPRSTFAGFDYHPQSIEMAQERAREAGVEDRSVSRWPPPRPSPARTTTWWPASIACTTWETRPGPPPTCASRCDPTGPGWSWSRGPAIGSRRI